jgi:hypothetical protein
MAIYRSGLDFGGGGPIKLTVANSPLTGEFYAIEADGSGNLTLGEVVSESITGNWTGTVLASGQTLLSGPKPFTSVSVSSGSGWVYKCA